MEFTGRTFYRDNTIIFIIFIFCCKFFVLPFELNLMRAQTPLFIIHHGERADWTVFQEFASEAVIGKFYRSLAIRDGTHPPIFIICHFRGQGFFSLNDFFLRHATEIIILVCGFASGFFFAYKPAVGISIFDRSSIRPNTFD